MRERQVAGVLLRTTACVAALVPLTLLAVESAGAVTISNVVGIGTGTVPYQGSPYHWCPGEEVEIDGTSFISDGGVVSVSIGNVPAGSYTVLSDSRLDAQIGTGATTGAATVVVTTNAGSFSIDSLPTANPNPGYQGDALKPGIQIYPCVSPKIVKVVVTGFKPSSAKGGAKVFIKGSGFAYASKVTVGGVSAIFAVVNDQKMVLIVPKTAPNGKDAIVITNKAGVTTSKLELVKKGSTASADPITAAAQATVARMKTAWQRALTRGATADPTKRYPSPSRATLVARLNAASLNEGFTIKSLAMLHPLQDAPVIVVDFPGPLSTEGKSFNQSRLAGILTTLKSESGRQLYEGFFLEALDGTGYPFYARYSAGRARVSKSWSRTPCGTPITGIATCPPVTDARSD